MNEPSPNQNATIRPEVLRALRAFEACWAQGRRPAIEEYLPQDKGPTASQLVVELLAVELRLRQATGELPERSDYSDRFDEQHVSAAFELVSAAVADSTVSSTPPVPPEIGRYRVRRVLGAGVFGRVYLAYDEQLERLVAIKTPHANRIQSAELQAYLDEARNVARLDHPHIVPVYDVGRSEGFPFFVVEKYIEGRTLAEMLADSRVPWEQAAELVAQLAEALDYAHRRGLVHRDVKPGNILIDLEGQPHLVDFGLALRDSDWGEGPTLAGSPAYMSPEQARGEGHRVDGRSDLFSLGIVLYELMTGRQPFRAPQIPELLRRISLSEPQPPRQIDQLSPAELERICLRALAKRASRRYPTGNDFARDLRRLLRGGQESPGQWEDRSTPVGGADGLVVPKGLRSFDAHDSAFFLNLLPGVRDADGLPESIRFWTARIESGGAHDALGGFEVGLIYGPSGCGKTSLMKAGLIPRLPHHVKSLYVEATREDTEARLLDGIHDRWPTLVCHHRLRDAVTALRRGEGLESGERALLVIDQFEQWLHTRVVDSVLSSDSHHDYADTELASALRHCDGRRVQSILLVRDDFWTSVSRLFRALDIRLIEDQNCMLVDLFDTLHARNVLAEFGRAYGRLSTNLAELSAEQNAFLDSAIAGVSRDGKVVPVRLSLFAEMLKSQDWTPQQLLDVGGAEGIGVRFLEETFGRTARLRAHEVAARRVLARLLPEPGADIKGHMQSAALLRAAAETPRAGEFEDLLRCLDKDLRLITPTERVSSPRSKEASDSTVAGVKAQDSTLAGATSQDATHASVNAQDSTLASTTSQDATQAGVNTQDSTLVSSGPTDGTQDKKEPSDPASADDEFLSDVSDKGSTERGEQAETLPGHHYQLTHDYLVPALRDWLTRGQKATRRGRAELRLAERAAIWDVKPEPRHLPTAWEYLAIRWWTRRSNWTDTQRRMMRSAGKRHRRRGAMALTTLVACCLTVLIIAMQMGQHNREQQAAAFAEQTVTADIGRIESILRQSDSVTEETRALLRARLNRGGLTDRETLNIHLALAAKDRAHVSPVLEVLPELTPEDISVARRFLARHASDSAIFESLWDVLEQGSPEAPGVLASASVAAALYPKDPRWQSVGATIAQAMVHGDLLLPEWIQLLEPAKSFLTPELSSLFRDRNDQAERHRERATLILQRYAIDDPILLAELLITADASQFQSLFQLASGELVPRLVERLEQELLRPSPLPRWPENAELTEAATELPTELPESAVVALEAAGGVVSLSHGVAFCQSIPREGFELVEASLQQAGFRPLRIRPYFAADSQLLVAAIWRRDGRAGRVIWDLESSRVAGIAAEHRVVDCAQYWDGDEEHLPRYVVAAVAQRGGPASHVLAGVSEQQIRQRTEQLQAQGASLTALHVGHAPAVAAFSAVWTIGVKVTEIRHQIAGFDQLLCDVSTAKDLPLSTDNTDGANADDADADGTDADGTDADGTDADGTAGAAVRVAALWRVDPAFESRVESLDSPGDQRRRANELLAMQWRPVAIAVSSDEASGVSRQRSVVVWQRPYNAADDIDRVAQRQANAAATLLRLGQLERTDSLLVADETPSMRSYLLERIRSRRIPTSVLMTLWDAAENVSAQRALVLAIGEQAQSEQLELGAEQRRELVKQWLTLYREHPDPGMHAATGWALRQMGQQVALDAVGQQLSTGRPANDRQWYHTRSGQVMVTLSPNSFLMGSPLSEAERTGGPSGKNEVRHLRTIPRKFAIAARETTVRLYRQFREASGEKYRPGLYGEADQSPASQLTWYGAAKFCNWLSEREGIPEPQWCYDSASGFQDGMKLKPDYLSLAGYRLPTEAEWEYACRAGAVTTRFYGVSDRLLGRYAVFRDFENPRTQFLACGSLLPNEYGLFDVLGNVSEWCQDQIAVYPAPVAVDEESPNLEIRNRVYRVLRGGSFGDRNGSATVRSACRLANFPQILNNYYGFRVARTMDGS